MAPLAPPSWPPLDSSMNDLEHSVPENDKVTNDTKIPENVEEKKTINENVNTSINMNLKFRTDHN